MTLSSAKRRPTWLKASAKSWRITRRSWARSMRRYDRSGSPRSRRRPWLRRCDEPGLRARVPKGARPVPGARAAGDRRPGAAGEEDVGAGELPTVACVPESKKARGRFLAREPLVIAGLGLLAEIYERRGGVDDLSVFKRDGDPCVQGEKIAVVSGRARTLLECERVALNFLQRLSGVATAARRYADAVAGTKCRVLDTRKTTPGLRLLEKMAAAAGGVVNHRMGLFDAVLIKKKHIAAAGGVRNAIERARAGGLPVEVEVRTREELREALNAGAEMHADLALLQSGKSVARMRAMERRLRFVQRAAAAVT